MYIKSYVVAWTRYTRGECLFDFILCSYLSVVNIVVVNRREVRDITLDSTRNSGQVRSWTVSNDFSFSDHRYVEFCLETQEYGVNHDEKI